jgi:hypothetical protein
VYTIAAHPALFIARFERPGADMEFRTYLARLLRHYHESPTQFVVLIDSSVMPALTGSQIQMQGLWMKQHEALIRRRCLGVAFVFKSPLSRFVLSSILLFSPMQAPYQVYATPAEAIAWAGGRLRAGEIDPAEPTRFAHETYKAWTQGAKGAG